MPTIITKEPQISGSLGIGSPGEETNLYRITFEDRGHTTFDAITASGVDKDGKAAHVPVYFELLEGTSSYVCMHKRAELNPANPCEFLVSVQFHVPVPAEQPAPAILDTENGSRWAIEIAISPIPYEEQVEFDIRKNALINTAAVPYLGVTIPRTDFEIVLSFTTNIPDWPGIRASLGDLGRGCVNTEDFELVINGTTRFFLAGTVRFIDWAMTSTLDPSGVIYPRFTYRMRERRILQKDDKGDDTFARSWWRMLANEGLVNADYDYSDVTHVQPTTWNIKNASGQSLTSVVPYKTTWGTVAGKKVPMTVRQATVGDEWEFNLFELFEGVDLGTILVWDLYT